MSCELASILDVIERERGGKAIVFAASNLTIDLMPTLYDVLDELSPISALDVVIHCRGGEITAAGRLGRILSESTQRLALLVPFYCTSAGTVMSLAADEIIAGSTAVFSPVDPQLAASTECDRAEKNAISAEDVRLLAHAYTDWFGVDEKYAGKEALTRLSDSIFPTTITSFYRATIEIKKVCGDLLSLRAGRYSQSEIEQIIINLAARFQSHQYPISAEELAALSLPVKRHRKLENAAWRASKCIREIIGGGLRATPSDDWFDVMIASRQRTMVRRITRQRLEPVWEEMTAGDRE